MTPTFTSKLAIASSLALALTFGSAAAVQADELSVSTTIDATTDYVFRGVSLADTAIQPGVEASYGNFTAGAWFSTGIGDTSVVAGDELDLYMSYGFTLSDTISASAGVTYYHYPQGGSLFATEDGGAGTYELSLGAEFDLSLSPSLTAYYDLTLEAFTLEGGIGHSIPTGDKTSFDLGLTAGLVTVDDGTDYQYAQASAALSYAFTDTTSAYLGANFALSSEDTLDYKKGLLGDAKDNLLFFGAGIASGF